MKKRFLLFAVFLATYAFVAGQTFIYEDFSSSLMPPTGWTIDGLPAQWSVSMTSNAGGVAPEAMFTYTNGTTTTRLISPNVNLTGLTSVKLTFRHYYNFYATPAPKVGVATRSAGGPWHTVWEITPTGNVGPQEINLDISNTDVGSSQFQLCFYLNGNMYNINYWYLDDVMLLNPLNKDGFLTSIAQTPSYISGPAEIKGSILNAGLTTITDAVVAWKLDSGMTHNTTISGVSAQTLQSFDFTCTDQMNPPIGSHLLTVWIVSINGTPDDNQANDTLFKTVSKVCYSIALTPLYEEFTSSTCGPCATFNASFVPWCLSHDSDITLVKYQMNWPGNGDPYYTLEGGVRRDYYGVGWVPWLEVDGLYTETDMIAVQNAFDQETAKIGMMDIAASHSVNGHIITVNAAVLPFANFTGCRLYIAVIEKVTHNNASTNGETSFHHVMMKMIPDAEGTAVDFLDRQPFTYTNTIDLTGTHIEEWNDLMVVVWVQGYASKQVFQSIYSVENGTFGTENRLSDIQVNGTSIPGFNSNTFTYDVTLPSGTVTVPDVTGVPIDPNETVIVVPPLTLPGTTTIDVFAENNVAYNQYLVNFSFPAGIHQDPVETLNLYPNPASNRIFITGADHSRITINSISGTTLKQINCFTGTSIDVSDLSKGIYILKVERTDHRIIQKKIVKW